MEAPDDLGKQRDQALVRAAMAALIARGVTSIAAVGTLALAAQALSKAEVGVVAVLTTLVVFLGFGDLGLGTLVMTRLPAANARGDQEGSRVIVSGVLSTLCTVGAGLGIVGIISAFVVPWQTILGAEDLSESGVRAAVICFVLFGALSIPAGLGARVLAAMQRSATMHLWSSAAGVLSMVLAAVAYAAELPMWGYVAAISAPTALVGIVQTAGVLTRTFPHLRPRTLRVGRAQKLALLRSGLMFAALSLSAVTSFYIDSLVVSAVRGAEDAAVFAIAARMFALIGGTLNLAGQQMWTALADAMARGDREWARRRFRHVLLVTTGINAVACGALVLAGQAVARAWVGDDIVPPRSLLLALAAWTLLSTAIFQANYVLAAVEQIRTITIIGLCSAPVNVVLSTVCTHLFGLPGPTVGSLATVTLMLVGPSIVLNRRELNREPTRAPGPEAAAAASVLWSHQALVRSTPVEPLAFDAEDTVGQHPGARDRGSG
jgi:O-antigen/teichoic acid export membrane protein